MKNKVSVSYWLAKEKEYSVEVKAFYNNKWMWCIYIHVSDGCPLFHNNDELLNFGMHGGVTFDRQRIDQYIGDGKLNKSKTVGCDYEHIWDDYENHPSPFDYPNGDIPNPFHDDALEIKKRLEVIMEKASKN